MWWKKASCPVRPVEQQWIDENLDWYVAEFGADVLRREVVLPERSFLPAGYTGSEDDVRELFAIMCDRLEVPPGRVRLDLQPVETDELLENLPMFESSSSGAAAHWQRRDGVTVVTVDMADTTQPVGLIATMAHELAHQRLLGEQRIDPDRRDGEPLTDLFTVFFGFGIFNANAAFEFYRTGRRGYGTRRLGYLTEAMYGYALGRYAWLRGEREPDWARYLDTNPREWMKQSVRWLESDVG
ncbi:hypothetical protein [Kribbella sp. NPDC048915]|uniref:hypothetical protein n=1 Tax=Kribbella sp. NPDC048915 TaxID=3155148 RepID=UPI0033CCDAF5